MKKILLIILLGATQTQAQEVIYHVFQRSFFDSNGDGQLSHDELRSGMQQQMQKMNAEPTTK